MLHDIKRHLRELLAESKAVLVNGSDQTDGEYLGKRTPTGGTYVYNCIYSFVRLLLLANKRNA